MSQIQICPQGHRWDPARDTRTPQSARWTTCPECGREVECFSLHDTHSPGTPANQQVSGSPDPAVVDPEPQVPGYEIIRRIGRGGMGVVHMARQVATDRIVAIKVLASGARAGSNDLLRFCTENKVIQRVSHPHIVRVWEVGDDPKSPFAVLEYMDRGSLKDAIADNPLPPRCAAEVVEMIARAIQCAHTAGILHRDLKPANILLTTPRRDDPLYSSVAVRLLGIPKVSDFGLAREIAGGGVKTVTGTVLGTPEYMSPEQAQGKTRHISFASDVYSLGAVLYECLTGRPPFVGTTVLEILYQVRYAEPVPPSRLRSGVPGDLEIICLKCLRKDPRERYLSAEELADDLRRYLQTQPIRARPPANRWRALCRVVCQPTNIALLLAVALFVLAFLLALFRR